MGPNIYACNACNMFIFIWSHIPLITWLLSWAVSLFEGMEPVSRTKPIRQNQVAHGPQECGPWRRRLLSRPKLPSRSVQARQSFQRQCWQKEDRKRCARENLPKLPSLGHETLPRREKTCKVLHRDVRPVAVLLPVEEKQTRQPQSS